MFKCIECGEDAEYIYQGNSLCSGHLTFYTDEGKAYETKYNVLLNEYIGSIKTLDYFFRKVGEKYINNFTFKNKCNLVKTINDLVDKHKITKRIIDETLNIAIHKSNFKVGFIISIMKANQAKLDAKTANNNEYYDVYAEIAN